MPSSFTTIGLVGRCQDTRVNDAMVVLARHIDQRGLQVLLERGSGCNIEGVAAVPGNELARRADLVVAVGGDGTMLYATRLLARRSVPLLGINRGRLGFLADIGPDDMLARLDDILEGRYEVEGRLLLEARLEDEDGKPLSGLALNDVVVQKWDIGRMLELEAWVDGLYVNTHAGDGLIVATPTGSTAYALSCGGPILAPALDAIALVPICPHTLSDRPIVIRSEQKIEVRVVERPDTKAQVTCDGNMLGEIRAGETLRIRAARRRLKLVHPPGHDYYKILRSKLRWGRGDKARPDGDSR